MYEVVWNVDIPYRGQHREPGTTFWTSQAETKYRYSITTAAEAMKTTQTELQ